MIINYYLSHTPTLIQTKCTTKHTVFTDVVRRLNANSIDYCILGGTLIGLIRDGAPVATDTDYDIALLNVDPETIKSLFSDLPLAVETSTNEIQQLVYYPSQITIDFHFYRSTKIENKYQCFHQAGRIYLELEKTEEIMFHSLENEPVKVPKNVISYLDMKYGDWRIPQKQKKGRYFRRAITFGCFDPFHFGHLNLIRNAQKQSTDLTVIVRTDEHIRKYKNREPVFSEQVRLEQMKAFGDAYLSENQEYDYWIDKLDPDIVFVEEGFPYQLSCITIRLPRTPNISSSLIRESLGLYSGH